MVRHIVNRHIAVLRRRVRNFPVGAWIVAAAASPEPWAGTGINPVYQGIDTGKPRPTTVRRPVDPGDVSAVTRSFSITSGA